VIEDHIQAHEVASARRREVYRNGRDLPSADGCFEA